MWRSVVTVLLGTLTTTQHNTTPVPLLLTLPEEKKRVKGWIGWLVDRRSSSYKVYVAIACTLGLSSTFVVLQ